MYIISSVFAVNNSFSLLKKWILKKKKLFLHSIIRFFGSCTECDGNTTKTKQTQKSITLNY